MGKFNKNKKIVTKGVNSKHMKAAPKPVSKKVKEHVKKMSNNNVIKTNINKEKQIINGKKQKEVKEEVLPKKLVVKDTEDLDIEVSEEDIDESDVEIESGSIDDVLDSNVEDSDSFEEDFNTDEEMDSDVMDLNDASDSEEDDEDFSLSSEDADESEDDINVDELPDEIVQLKEEVKEQEKSEIKSDLKETVLDESTPIGKLLKDMNDRNHEDAKKTIFLKKVPNNATEAEIIEGLTNVAELSRPIVNRKQKPKDFCFIHFVTELDAEKGIEKLNAKTLYNRKMEASKFTCKNSYQNINNVNFNKVIVYSSCKNDVSSIIKQQCPKISNLSREKNGNYILTFGDKSDAMTLFLKKTIKIGSSEFMVNLNYDKKQSFENSVIPEPNNSMKSNNNAVKIQDPKNSVEKSNKPTSKSQIISVKKGPVKRNAENEPINNNNKKQRNSLNKSITPVNKKNKKGGNKKH